MRVGGQRLAGADWPRSRGQRVFRG